MQPAAADFPARAEAALANAPLRQALAALRAHSIGARARAAAALPEFEALRDAARDLKDHVLGNLEAYLLRFEAQVTGSGGKVHWARDAESARRIVLDICRRRRARLIAKGKTMIGEEIGLNEALSAAGMTPVETDLGEYIIQLRGEAPSHIVGPAVHVTQEEVAAAFRRAHAELDPDRPLAEAGALMAEARAVLRRQFLAADVGITGANLLIAEEGAAVIVTNEGNGDLAQTLPRVHVVLASIEKVVPTLADAFTILRVLARSATGQEQAVYTTFATGSRRPGDSDGPEEFHVVLLDNGRSALLGGEFEAMLRCIRCGACLDHCPVYHSVGGHAYGWTYSGPIGAVLSPALLGIERAQPLPSASTLCGRCEEVCPVRIPLPSLLRRWREQAFARRLAPAAARHGLRLWAFLAGRPLLYGLVARLGAFILRRLAGRKGRITHARLPLAAAWLTSRDLPAPEGIPFRARHLPARHRPARRSGA